MALAVVVALSAVSGPVYGGQDPTRVDLVFAWPRDFQADLEIQQVVDKGEIHAEVTTRCRLGLERHAKGMLVACRDATISPQYPGQYAVVSELLRIAVEFDWLVTAKGEFVGVTNTERVMQASWKLPGPAKTPLAERKRLEELMLAANEADARNSWAMLVSAWSGAALRVGQDLSIPGDLDTPMMPGSPVKGSQTMRIDRWLDCPGKATARCVEARAILEADPVTFTTALDRFFKTNATRPLGEPIRRTTHRREVVLVTDPATLVPYVLKVKTLDVVAYGDVKEARQAIEKTWTFTYPAGKESAPSPAAPSSLKQR
jgi:hypothetical protein